MNQVIADLIVKIAYYVLVAYIAKSIKEVVMMWLAGGSSLTTIFPPRTPEEMAIDEGRLSGRVGYATPIKGNLPLPVIGDEPEVREINVH